MKKISTWVLAVVPTLWANAQAQDFVEYARCQPEDYIIITDTVVNIQTQGSSYTPPCIKVKPETTVSIFASHHHPLQAAEDFNLIVNPFHAPSDHTETQTRTLHELGFYGYYCSRHGDAADGSGMGGMIWVTNE